MARADIVHDPRPNTTNGEVILIAHSSSVSSASLHRVSAHFIPTCINAEGSFDEELGMIAKENAIRLGCLSHWYSLFCDWCGCAGAYYGRFVEYVVHRAQHRLEPPLYAHLLRPIGVAKSSPSFVVF